MQQGYNNYVVFKYGQGRNSCSIENQELLISSKSSEVRFSFFF